MTGRGRPAIKPSERKRNNLTFRVRDALKDELRFAAMEAGRSLSEEVEHRLEQSFKPSLEEWIRCRDAFMADRKRRPRAWRRGRAIGLVKDTQ